MVNRIGDTIRRPLTLAHILKPNHENVYGYMFIDTSSVMLLNRRKRTEYQVYLADGERKKEVEQIILGEEISPHASDRERKKELTNTMFLKIPRYKSICEDCSRDFETPPMRV